jgi:DNA-binding CsgD family transcriptional regulator
MAKMPRRGVHVGPEDKKCLNCASTSAPTATSSSSTWMPCVTSWIASRMPILSASSEQLEARIRDGLPLADDSEATADHLVAICRAWGDVRRECPPGTVFGDLLTVATPSVSYESADARLLRLAKWIREKIDPMISPTVTAMEIARMVAPVRVIRATSDEDRIAAAHRLAEWLGRVVYPARWRWVKPALDELSRVHRHSRQVELRSRIISGLFDVVGVAGAYTLAEGDVVRDALRQKLNDLVTVDVLGPGWREMTSTTGAGGEARTLSPEVQIEARLEVERLIAQAGLSRREAEVLQLVVAKGREHGTLKEVADHLGIRASTVRVVWRRAQGKIAKVRSVGH